MDALETPRAGGALDPRAGGALDPRAGGALETDVAIIGAGPVGLFAVFELGMLRIRSVLIDALGEVGGQCTALYPEKPIYDIPAHAAIAAGDLVAALEDQIAPFATPRLLGQRVTTLSGTRGAFTLATDAGHSIHAKAVVIAAGAGAFGPNRPPLPGIEAFEASGAVRYHVRRREELRGKRVVIAGGGDSAVDWALALRGIAAAITVVHRRPKFRAAPETAAQMQAAADAGELAIATPYQLRALEGADGALRSVLLADLDGATRAVPADVLLAFFGLSTDLGPIAAWGLALEHGHVAVTAATCETSVPGIFAIGDIASYAGKLKLILQGFSEAAMAAHAIHPIVYPDTALHFEYSTSKGVPG
jgi:thioredoxin reductase (NADPH)